MCELNPAGGVRMDVIWDGSYFCTAWVVEVNIKNIVIQGVEFITKTYKINCLHMAASKLRGSRKFADS